MNKLTSLIRRAPKRLSAVVAIIAAAIIIPTALQAWGPDRPLFKIADRVDHITFNSMTDNPAHGYEPNFMQVREATASNTTYSDSISLQPGKEYVIYMYYHNNAAPDLNLVATNTKAKAEIPAVVKKGSAGTIANGYISADNARQTQIWDDISFKNSTNGDIALRFVPGSATIHSKGAVNGMKLSDTIITTGAALGYNALDGKVPGCHEFAGYVTFRVKADQPNFELSKKVRIAGTTDWKESVNVKNGDLVDYLLEYKNTGTTEQNNVTLKDTPPKGVDYIKGSTVLRNTSNANKSVSDNLFTSGGLNIGTYTPGSNALVKYQAKVSVKDLVCGKNTLKNTATVVTNNGSKSDDATVTVTKDCEPEVPENITVCELSTKKIITIDESKFDASKHSKNLDDCKNEPPVTPPEELPQTGIGEDIVAITGLGALIASGFYYIASRRILG